MDLPWGATKDDFEKCRNIISKLTGNREVDELALDLLHIIESHDKKIVCHSCR